MDRTRVWLAVSPLIAAGVLASHALAYRLTATPEGSLHAYLDHAPQILIVLAVVGLVVAGLGARVRLPSAWPFPAAALATFVVQEHVERLTHASELPWLVTTPAFVVGLALQAVVAVLVWAFACLLLRALEAPRLRPVRLPRLPIQLAAPATGGARPVPARPLPGRGPPLPGRS